MKTRTGVMLKYICPYAFMHMSLWLSVYVLKFYCIHPYAYILMEDFLTWNSVRSVFMFE